MARVKKLVLFHHDPTYSDEQLLDIQQFDFEIQAAPIHQPVDQRVDDFDNQGAMLGPVQLTRERNSILPAIMILLQ